MARLLLKNPELKKYRIPITPDKAKELEGSIVIKKKEDKAEIAFLKIYGGERNGKSLAMEPETVTTVQHA